ncbi:MAG: hypothetical protein JWL77_1732 [Chthonomonadaceae bacterium]|nr:hypothetical protein [Chthonomonadaceae bacterium]
MNALLPVYSSNLQKPFAIETIARQELQCDRLFPRLTSEQREFYITAALAIGAREAAHHSGASMLSLAHQLGTRVEEYDGGNVVAGCEIYAEYDVVSRRIRLHRAGVAHLAVRLGQTLPEAIAQETARDLLIAHELFHHLEATCLGPVHRTLPSISVSLVGRLWRVQRHILRTREIAAHSFAHTVLGMTERLDRG